MLLKFSDLVAGDQFMLMNEGCSYMKVFGHMLANIVNEGTGGHAVCLDTGHLVFVAEFEKVYEVKILKNAH